jgi:hypothetical protein
MSFPLVNLDTPTQVALHWGWLLVTRANAVVAVLVVVVFVLGATVRVPGAQRHLVEAAEPADESDSGSIR